MVSPAQRGLGHSQTVSLDNGLDEAEGIECRVLEVPIPVQLPAFGGVVAVSAFSGDILGFVFAGEKTAGERVVDDYVHVVSSADVD